MTFWRGGRRGREGRGDWKRTGHEESKPGLKPGMAKDGWMEEESTGEAETCGLRRIQRRIERRE